MISLNKHHPPGPKGRLLAGSLREFQADRAGFFLRCQRTYGDLVHLRLGWQHVYLASHPDTIRYVLVDHPENFHKSPILKRNTRAIIGNGLLTSEGDFHRRQRRLVQPAFHTKRIEAYADIMIDYTQRMLDEWEDGARYDIAQEMMKLTLGIVAKALFDADVRDTASEIGAAVTLGIRYASSGLVRPFRLPVWLPTRGSSERMKAWRLMENTIMGIINERRASGEDKGDLLSMLLLAVDEEDGGQMTNQQVRDEAMTLFLAGHETTANALSWTFYLLAQHPAVEAKLLEEVDNVLGGRPATYNDLRQLRYTEMVIKESMRLYPPAWVFTRLVLEDFELGGYRIPRNALVIMSPWVMHRDPRYFEEPERFEPERFTEEREKQMARYTYLPFGGGPRYCVGSAFAMMEATLVLATIAQRYHLALVPGQKVETEPLITLRPRGGIQMEAALRQPVPVEAGVTSPIWRS